ncbi:MAG: hypothetical protein L3K09_00565 [Thermoplasmata archaeon]|nr:hypothetical protein [Thermoplasmata archaeon]
MRARPEVSYRRGARPPVSVAPKAGASVPLVKRLESALPLFIAAAVAAILSFVLFGSSAHIANSHYPLWGLIAAIGAVTAVGGVVAVYAAGSAEGTGFEAAADGTSVVVPIGEWREIQRQLHRQLERYEPPREGAPLPGGAAAAVARAAPSLTRDSMYVPASRPARPAPVARPPPKPSAPMKSPVAISLSNVPKEWEESATSSLDTVQLASDLDRLISQIHRAQGTSPESIEPRRAEAPPADYRPPPSTELLPRTGEDGPRPSMTVPLPRELRSPKGGAPAPLPESPPGLLPPKTEVELPKEFVEFVKEWYTEQESRKKQSPSKTKADLAAAQAQCVSCGRPLVGGRSALDCASCGGGLCDDCAQVALAPIHGRRCPDCVATAPDWDEASRPH